MAENCITLDKPVDHTRSDAIMRGLGVFDYSLPKEWWDHAIKHTGYNPSGHVVWCYDGPPDKPGHEGFGFPVAIDKVGEWVLGRLSCRR